MLKNNEEKMVHVMADNITLAGFLSLPATPFGIVLFAHGSGSGRFSPRNRAVASDLYKNGLSTLLIDLLSETEDEVYSTRFDIALLARRLKIAAQWLLKHPVTAGLPLGLFGSSTGAAAALILASEESRVKAVVSRGGRPDLAGPTLSKIKAPTLLIVGGDDEIVLDLNREAYEQLFCPKELAVIPGATHLFEEPGALEQVSRLAADWFIQYLSPPEERRPSQEASHRIV